MIKKSLLITLSLFIITFTFSLDVPALKGYVNDYADMISPSAENEIELKLKSLEQTDSTQIVILTIPSLEGEALEDYSIKVAEEWKIGQKNKDNGAIFLVSKNDRKMRIEVGYGLEGVITDLLAGRIIDDIAAPYFRNGEMDQGFNAVTDALVGTAKGEFTTDNLPASKKTKDGTFPSIIFFIIVIFWFNFSRIFPKKIRGLLGGIFGFIIVLIFGLIGGLSIVGLIILCIIGFIFGLILTLIFTSTRLTRGGHRSRFFGGSSGGFSSGGSSFSGGGGSFGGGGASGGW
jgi:uncharacterized protein